MKGVRSISYSNNSMCFSSAFQVYTSNNLKHTKNFFETSPGSIVQKFQTPPSLYFKHSLLLSELEMDSIFLEQNSPIDSKSPNYSNLIENAQLIFDCNHLIPKTIHT
jgi:hypothetical protein